MKALSLALDEREVRVRGTDPRLADIQNHLGCHLPVPLEDPLQV